MGPSAVREPAQQASENLQVFSGEPARMLPVGPADLAAEGDPQTAMQGRKLVASARLLPSAAVLLTRRRLDHSDSLSSDF
jgi:hypothetical protein